MQSTFAGLRDGFPGGNPHLAPRCGAKTRVGKPCGSPAMQNGRCRMHGGASSGPKTVAGKAAQCAAVTVHGFRGEFGRVFAALRRDIIDRTRLRATAAKIAALRRPTDAPSETT